MGEGRGKDGEFRRRETRTVSTNNGLPILQIVKTKHTMKKKNSRVY